MRDFRLRVAIFLGRLPYPVGKWLFHVFLRGIGKCPRCGNGECGVTLMNCKDFPAVRYSPWLTPLDGPIVEGLESYEVVYAKDQPEYIPLRTLVSRDRQRRVMSRWTLTDEQRKAVAGGADIFLILATFGQPLQPILMQVAHRFDKGPVAADFGFNPDPVHKLREVRA